jgi:hypothetical protein
VQLSTALREAQIDLYSVTKGLWDEFTDLYQGYQKGVRRAEDAGPPNLGLKVIAVQSGGRVLAPDNDLAGQIGKCIEDAKAYYRLTFSPPRADRPNEYHALEVRVGKPGLKARTNTGYYNQRERVPAP